MMCDPEVRNLFTREGVLHRSVDFTMNHLFHNTPQFIQENFAINRLKLMVKYALENSRFLRGMSFSEAIIFASNYYAFKIFLEPVGDAVDLDDDLNL